MGFGMAMCRLLVAALLTAPALVQGQAERARTLTDPPSIPIPQLLRPGDVTVTLDPGLLPPLEAEISSSMPAGDLLRGHAKAADWVVVGKVVERRAHLTPDETWIVTAVHVEVLEQFKPKAGATEAVIEIEEQGGTVSIDGVTVTAVATWQQRLGAGETYLLFVTKTSRRAQLDWSYRINSGQRLESTFPPFLSGEAFDTADGLRLEQARVILRSGV